MRDCSESGGHVSDGQIAFDKREATRGTREQTRQRRAVLMCVADVLLSSQEIMHANMSMYTVIWADR